MYCEWVLRRGGEWAHLRIKLRWTKARSSTKGVKKWNQVRLKIKWYVSESGFSGYKFKLLENSICLVALKGRNNNNLGWSAVEPGVIEITKINPEGVFN